jgi:plasmid stabilization system protein ParE
MNYEVKVTRQAHGQMREIALYIANECCAPEAAQNLLDKLEKSINDLAEMPSRHSLVDEEPWRSAGVRRVIVKHFLIYFWVDEENKKVQVTGVIYEKRDQLARLAEMEWE